MQLLPYIAAYAAIAVFVIAVLMRIRMWLKMPIHVRWELYPVAHEPGERANYGGSYLEDGEWWTKKREVSLLGELKVMIPEILFLVALKENNPKLWVRSFPFHFGLYLVTGATALLLLAGLLGMVVPTLMAGAVGTIIGKVIVGCGFAGLSLSIIGAVGLLQRRLTEPGLREFTTGADVFNLLFFIVAFGTALANAFIVDPEFAVAGLFATNLVTFNLGPLPGEGLSQMLPLASVVLMSLLVAYIPLTHMSHFIGKYFAYHAIRWNDTPNVPGGPEEAKIQAVLGQKVTWAADHVDAKGEKTWVDLATEEFKK